MSEKNVIVFHIGTPKTGTTALQFFLEANNEQLKQKGWIYPVGKNSQSPLRVWNQSRHGGNGACLVAEDGNFFNSSFEEILEYAEQYNVVISCENIWILDYTRMEEFFRAVLDRYDNIKAVVYLRRQDEYIESIYNQDVKFFHKISMTISEFFDSLDFSLHWFNYLHKLEILEKLLGNRLIVRRCPKDTIADFLSLIGLELKNPVTPSLSAEEESDNLSLGSRLLEIKRIMNGLIDFSSHYEWKIRELNRDNIISGRKDFYKVMSPEMRQKILDRYAEDNKEIARRYLKDGKPLFENMDVEIPYKEYRATPFEEEMIRVFFTFINDLDRQIKNIAVKSIGNRKNLAYFGAGNICKDCLESGLYRPDIIIDNKGGREINGIPVISLNEVENWKDYYVIITTTRFQLNNRRYLQMQGLKETQDYVYYGDLDWQSN